MKRYEQLTIELLERGLGAKLQEIDYVKNEMTRAIIHDNDPWLAIDLFDEYVEHELDVNAYCYQINHTNDICGGYLHKWQSVEII